MFDFFYRNKWCLALTRAISVLLSKLGIFTAIKQQERICKQAGQTVQIVDPTNTKCSVAFVEALQKLVVGSALIRHEDIEDSAPLIVVCPLVSRLEPDVNHATFLVRRSSPYVVIILHTGSERNLPMVPSERQLKNYNNITFIDMGLNDQDAIYKCQHNDNAMDQLRSYIEPAPLLSIPSTLGTVSNGQSSLPKLFLSDSPWRFNSIQSENSLKQDIEKLSPKNKLAILLIGPAGSGKSSFINSCLKAMAPPESSNSSFPLICHSDDNRLLENVRFMELQGFDVDRNNQFDPEKQMITYSKHDRGKREDETRCIVFVIDAREMQSGISNEYVEKIRSLQETIRHKFKDCLQMIILTKADLLCDEVLDDPAVMFRSLKIHKALKTASEMFSIDTLSIHPVINYLEDEELSTTMTIPILLVLRKVLWSVCDLEEQVRNAYESESDEEVIITSSF